MPQRRFVFVDETGVNLDLARSHARAPRGQRAVDASVPRNTPARTGLVGAMGVGGLICSMQVEGAVDGAAFLVFVQEVLGPHLRRGDFVVLDNLNTHGSAKVEAAILARGAFLLFLPTYSPDMNPIEGAWSKLKAHLRRVAARTAARLDAALAEGLAAITSADARGWFTHAGYRLGRCTRKREPL